MTLEHTTRTLLALTFAAFRFQDVERVISRLSNAGRLTVIVGAGVSMEANLPSWPELITRLLERVARQRMTQATDQERTAWVTETVERDQYLGAGAVVAALSSEQQLESWIFTELYGGDGPNAFAPGPTALGVARLHRTLSGELRILTLNYDDLLQRALETEYPEDAIQTVSGEDALSPDVSLLSVTHLHGYAGRGGVQGPLVLSEEQYQQMQLSDSWQERLVTELLGATTCLFVGTSLSDPNLVRYLHGYNTPEDLDPRHGVVFVREAGPQAESDRIRRLRERAAMERWRRRGVQAVFVDHFGDVAQLVYELGLARGTDPYRPVHQRATTWISQLERSLLGTDNDDAFRESQGRLSAHLRDALREAISAAERAGVDFGEERLAIGLWVASPNGQSITNWVTSDRAYQELGTIVPVPIDPASNWVSVETFRRGVRVQEGRDVYASRWRYVRGLPLYLDRDPQGRIPVGCLTITSTAARDETALESMSEEIEARFHEVLLRTVESLWEQV